jgi:phage shock protein PspC (stress-responsive transcriptional regulator)
VIRLTLAFVAGICVGAGTLTAYILLLVFLDPEANNA